MAYTIVSLEDMRNAFEDDKKVVEKLKEFKCDKNKDVEYFLHYKAIEFLKMDISKTFLVISEYKNENVIVGYFALTIKNVKVKKSCLSNKVKKKIKRFAINGENDKSKYFELAMPLIGQLSKNFNNGYNKLITGDELLKLACDKIREVQKILGGKFVYIECEDKDILREFYENNGFVCFDKRNLGKDEREKCCGEYLLQMLCDLSNNKGEN